LIEKFKRDLIDMGSAAHSFPKTGNNDPAVTMNARRRRLLRDMAGRRLRGAAEKLRNFCPVKAKWRLSPTRRLAYACIE
jgi:hypothetical protein